MHNNSRLLQVKNFYFKNQRLPSFREMAVLFKLSSRDSVGYQVGKWVKAGVLEKQNGKISPAKDFFALPLLGSIRAGFPEEAYESNETISIVESLVRSPENLYVLRVAGDSMVGAGINEGDLVILDKKREPKEKDIVVATVDNEWTLKYFKKIDGRIALMPANPAYSPIYPRESLTIAGVVVKVVREYY